MSFAQQDPRVGGAYEALPGQRQNDTRQGSVRAARERLDASQRNQELRSWEQSTSATNPPSSQYAVSNPQDRLGETPHYTSSPRSRTHIDSGGLSRSDDPTSWPLPDMQYRQGPHMAAPKQYSEQNAVNPSSLSPTKYSQTFYDDSRDRPPNTLQPPRSVYGARSNEPNMSAYGLPQTTGLMRQPSTASENSLGSIPDFPLPASQYQSGRRSLNPGPPPVSRRGPSSYYSGVSYGVSPIAEESDNRGSTNSYASSNVIPSRVPEFFLEETPSDEEDGSAVEFDFRKTDEDGVESSRLVRQASIGKRGRPALTTITTGDNLRPGGATSAGATLIADRGVRASIMSGQSVLLDASSSDRSRERERQSAIGMDISEPFNPDDPRAQEVLGGLEKGDSIERGSVTGLRQSRLGGLADRFGMRRPPSLNVDAVRQAEARGSLTSLPDLIKRATQLAANLDRGRTASRLGLDLMSDGEKSNRLQRPNNFQRASGGSSISGMLASFPPPGPLTPVGNMTPRGEWPSVGTSQKSLDSQKAYGQRSKNQRKKICGFSIKAFIFCLVIVLLLVAAAVVLPVVLIVLPNRSKLSSSSSGSTLQKCASENLCQNGGTSIVNGDGSCGCICTNGFTGATCQTQSNSGCTSLSIAGTGEASVGTQIPSLVSAARQSFGIPLDAGVLSSTFSSSNMTCTTENALVTFTVASTAQRMVKKSRTLTSAFEMVPKGSVQRRDPSTSPAATTTSSAPIIIGTGTAAPGTNATAQEFAKVGILFVLQDSRDLPMAVGAQKLLSQYLDSAVKLGSTIQLAQNVSLGSGYSIDLWDWTLTLRNQTVYGKNISSNNTATPLKLRN